MKNYIRTCLSLDEKTITTLQEIAMFYGTTMSEIVREATQYYHDHPYKQDVLEAHDQEGNR